MSQQKPKPLRQSMPTVAAWIDDLRAAFGRDVIDAAIRKGMAGGSGFYAEENGHTLGTPRVERGHVVSSADMILRTPGEAREK